MISASPLQPIRFSDPILPPHFSGAKNQVFLCLIHSSAADDPDMEDRVINKYMFKFITIYIHLFSFLHAWKTGIFASQYAPGIPSTLLLFASLGDLFANSKQNRMTWEKSRKHKEENKNHVEKEKHHLFLFSIRHLEFIQQGIDLTGSAVQDSLCTALRNHFS